MPAWLNVLLFALITALATGLGALPLLLVRKMPRQALGIANAVAAGLMLGASFRLTYEGFSGGDALWRTLLGAVAGLGLIVLSRKLIGERDDLRFAELRRVDAAKALLIFEVMALHSFSEGVAVGVAFGEGQPFGLFITLAIAIHNIPEGLAIGLVMVPRGTPVHKAAGWAVVSSLPQPLMAVPAFLLVDAFAAWLPVGLGFAAGAMLWMVIAELLPEAMENSSPRLVAVVTTLSLLAMQLIQVLLRV
jgi:zinc transporter ZupT